MGSIGAGLRTEHCHDIVQLHSPQFQKNTLGFYKMDRPLGYHEELRRKSILASMANLDYLLVIASQQQKSVQQVRYELMLKLKENF